MKKQELKRAGTGATELGAVGLEAEFVCMVDGEPVDPAVAFGDPRTFIGRDAMHRVGTSYHLPTGGAVYFDTGVIELVTPIIELEKGAPSQVVRSLWEGIHTVHSGLDGWADEDGRGVNLVGFSAHYNVSLPELDDGRRLSAMAWLLIHMLPFPVMLLAANPRSTGVGLRPRPGRMEVTVDFTPDPALMTAATAVIVAAVQEVSTWSRFDVYELQRRHYPVLDSITPVPHTSRKGWLVQAGSFERDPFRTPPDSPRWSTRGGRVVSMRDVARRTVAPLLDRIRATAEPETVDLIERVLVGQHPSLLDLEDRPAAYEDVGKLCHWQERDPRRPLPRSLYEQVMRDAITRRPLVADGRRWLPIGTHGWTRVLYRSDDGQRRVFTVDELVRLRRSRR